MIERGKSNDSGGAEACLVDSGMGNPRLADSGWDDACLGEGQERHH
jgi:hypothetical protein